MEAVACKLVRRDVVPDVTGLSTLPQQISNKAAELLLRLGDVLPSMQGCREFVAVVLVRNERDSLEYSFEPLDRVARAIPDFGEI